jgi:hypothetical protein
MIGIGFPELCADGTSRLQGLVEILGGLLLKSGVLSIVPAMALGNPVGRLPSMIVSSASSRSSGSPNNELVYSFWGTPRKHRDGKGLGESRHLQH